MPVKNEFNEPICFFCKQPTESFAGDPGRWPLMFCYGDNSGVPKTFHIRCLQDRLEEGERNKRRSLAAIVALSRIAGIVPDPVFLARETLSLLSPEKKPTVRRAIHRWRGECLITDTCVELMRRKPSAPGDMFVHLIAEDETIEVTMDFVSETTFQSASKEQACDMCGKKLTDHPLYTKWGAIPDLHRQCDGSVFKLWDKSVFDAMS